MSVFLAEFLGTMLLILLGNGVVANVSLKHSKGKDGGWIVVAMGWALAVAIPVFIFGPISGAHFNPAVTIGMATIGRIEWVQVIGYIVPQLLGAIVGACLVYVFYLPHWAVTEDAETKFGCFATTPAIPSRIGNFISEYIGTFVLVMCLLGIGQTEMVPGLEPIVVGLIILGIGLSLGGTTGYAINPVRDLGPRIAYAILPIPGKKKGDWKYAWIPVVAPILGGVTAAVIYNVLF